MKRSDLFFLLGLISIALFAGCDTAKSVDPVFEKQFVKFYGDAGDQSGADLVVSADGNMFLLGNSIAPNGMSNGFIAKVNSQGTVIWMKQVGELNETAVDLELITLGNHSNDLVVLLNVGPEATSKIRIVRLDQEGEVQDSTVLPLHAPNGKQVGTSITPLEREEGFLVTGYADKDYTFETSPLTTVDERDLLALKLNDALEPEPILSAGGEKNGALMKSYELPVGANSEIVFFGFSDKPVTAEFELNYTFYLPLSSIFAAGSSVGESDREEQLSTVVKSSSGRSFLMAGTSKLPGSTGGDIYLVKYGSSFQSRSFDKRISLNKNLQCVDADLAPGTNYLVLANEISGENLHDIVLTKIDFEGLPVWTRTFGTDDGDDSGAAVASLPDGRVAIVGTMELETNKKLALIVLSKQGGL